MSYRPLNGYNNNKHKAELIAYYKIWWNSFHLFNDVHLPWCQTLKLSENGNRITGHRKNGRLFNHILMECIDWIDLGWFGDRYVESHFDQTHRRFIILMEFQCDLQELEREAKYNTTNYWWVTFEKNKKLHFTSFFPVVHWETFCNGISKLVFRSQSKFSTAPLKCTVPQFQPRNDNSFSSMSFA